jgi:hypothetical protein
MSVGGDLTEKVVFWGIGKQMLFFFFRFIYGKVLLLIIIICDGILTYMRAIRLMSKNLKDTLNSNMEADSY